MARRITIPGLLVLALLGTSSAQDAPRVFLSDPAALAANKGRWLAGDTDLSKAVKRLQKDAEKALQLGELSVTTKGATPPSGDKHDYMSMGKYWWPDSTKPGGLPYIRRDGVVNPEVASISDDANFSRVIKAVAALGLAYYFTDNPSYASHAAALARAWFLDPATRMNPNLDFAQAVPGRSDGRGAGIIDTHLLPELLDGVGLIRTSKAWSREDQLGLEGWCEEYLRWLTTSTNGVAEAKAKNNHGTWYDVQAVALHLFLGRADSARAILLASRTKRIAAQIEPDGSQPLELARTKSWDYSFFNLGGFFALANLGDRVGVDLWNYATEDGRGIRKALEWLIPYILNEEEWPYPQIAERKTTGLHALLLQASVRYPGERFAAAARSTEGKTGSSERIVLILPRDR